MLADKRKKRCNKKAPGNSKNKREEDHTKGRPQNLGNPKTPKPQNLGNPKTWEKQTRNQPDSHSINDSFNAVGQSFKAPLVSLFPNSPDNC